MRILVATDAWPPQVNGVVRTLQSLATNVLKLDAKIEFLTPEGFRTFPLRLLGASVVPSRPGGKLRTGSSLQHRTHCTSRPKDQSGSLRGVIVSREKFLLRPAT